MVFLEEAPVTIGRAKHLDSDNRGTAEVACGHATTTTIFHWARAVIDTAYRAYCANRTILFTFLTCPHRIVFFDNSLFLGYLWGRRCWAWWMNNDTEGRSIPNTYKISSYHLCKRSSSVPLPLCNDWYPTTKDKWVGSPLGRRLDMLSNCSPVWLDLPCRRSTSTLCSSQLYSSLSSQDNFSVLRASEMGSSWMSIMQLKRSRRNHPDLDIYSSGASCPPAGISFIDFPSTYEKLTPCRDRHLMS